MPWGQGVVSLCPHGAGSESPPSRVVSCLSFPTPTRSLTLPASHLTKRLSLGDVGHACVQGYHRVTDVMGSLRDTQMTCICDADDTHAQISHPLPDASAALGRCCRGAAMSGTVPTQTAALETPPGCWDPSAEPQAGGCHPHGDPGMSPGQDQAGRQTPGLSQQEGAHSLRLCWPLPEKHLGLLKGRRQPWVRERDPGLAPRHPPPAGMHGPGKGTQRGCGCPGTSTSPPGALSGGPRSPVLLQDPKAWAKRSLGFGVPGDGDKRVPRAMAEGMETGDLTCCHPSGYQPGKGKSSGEQGKIPIPGAAADPSWLLPTRHFP